LVCNKRARVWSRWKEGELEDKIYGEQRMFQGEMKFPEFMFKPSQLVYNVSLHCGAAGVASEAGYTALQHAVCVPCLAGTFFNPYVNNCTRCPVNTYQDQLAARSCTRCHRNHYTQHVGMWHQLYTAGRLCLITFCFLPSDFFIGPISTLYKRIVEISLHLHCLWTTTTRT